MRLQGAIRLLYPPACSVCNAPVTEDHALCPACWRDTPFITGTVCDQCGTPLPSDGPADADQTPPVCDECIALARPWDRGRAALVYGGTARRIVLDIKHGDRLELIRPAARWLAGAAAPLLRPETLIVPVPLHWTRLLRRRFNQSAMLARALAAATGHTACPDLLVRRRRTPSQGGHDREARFRNLEGAIGLHPRRAGLARGRHVLLVDDVMTSGATLAAAADACLAGGARSVDVVVLARVAKDG